MRTYSDCELPFFACHRWWLGCANSREEMMTRLPHVGLRGERRRLPLPPSLSLNHNFLYKSQPPPPPPTPSLAAAAAAVAAAAVWGCSSSNRISVFVYLFQTEGGQQLNCPWSKVFFLVGEGRAFSAFFFRGEVTCSCIKNHQFISPSKKISQDRLHLRKRSLSGGRKKKVGLKSREQSLRREGERERFSSSSPLLEFSVATRRIKLCKPLIFLL